MSNTRTRYSANYLYPGAFMPEDITVPVLDFDLKTLVEAGPDEPAGYFKSDGWYGVKVKEIVEKRFTSDDGESIWVKSGEPKVVAHYLVGEKFNADAYRLRDEEFAALRSNARSMSPTQEIVKTRCGNWQPVEEGTRVVSPYEAAKR